MFRGRSDIYNRIGKNDKGEILLIKDYRFSSGEFICENQTTGKVEHLLDCDVELMPLKLKTKNFISREDDKEIMKKIFGKNMEHHPFLIQMDMLKNHNNEPTNSNNIISRHYNSNAKHPLFGLCLHR